jgi:hypothetical protein
VIDATKAIDGEIVKGRERSKPLIMEMVPVADRWWWWSYPSFLVSTPIAVVPTLPALQVF